MIFNESSICKFIKIEPIDGLRLSIKIIGLLFHLVYLLLDICCKQMRSKQMVFLNNYNIVVIIILSYSLFRELGVCVTDLSCSVEAIGLFLSISYESYSVCLLLAYRYVCILTDKIHKILKWKLIILTLVLFYLLVFLLNLIIYTATKTEISFSMTLSRCLIVSQDGIFIHLMLVFNHIIPSIITICGAIRILVFIKSKNTLIVPGESRSKTNLNYQSAFELSWQIIVFVVSHAMFTISNYLILYNLSLGDLFLSESQVYALRCFRWSAFIVDLFALYFFNPLIRQFFKNLWFKIKNLII